MTGLPHWAVPGRKVVCIDGHFPVREDFEELPIEGLIYTIRAIDDGEGLWLVEIVNPEAQYLQAYGECSFLPRRFRPLVTLEEDVALFLTLLSPSHTTDAHTDTMEPLEA